LIDLSYVAFEDLYLVVPDTPLKIDSVMSALSKKNYSTLLGILDTLKQEFKVYNVMENNSKNKFGNKINKTLKDCNHYKSGYLFSLNDTIKKIKFISWICYSHTCTNYRKNSIQSIKR